ncbi:unnamed protein product [Amoebophrya sp. A120]|nr:unnamed protein product [Amoebophrya sp. A120]|eukprot:GSA120T00012678001.1
MVMMLPAGRVFLRVGFGSLAMLEAVFGSGLGPASSSTSFPAVFSEGNGKRPQSTAVQQHSPPLQSGPGSLDFTARQFTVHRGGNDADDDDDDDTDAMEKDMISVPQHLDTMH